MNLRRPAAVWQEASAGTGRPKNAETARSLSEPGGGTPARNGVYRKNSQVIRANTGQRMPTDHTM